ncbi:tyrosine-type recombinase/integrase [Dokdonella sp. MW10]|uniref:tyrosine-type recombinase/integrase n=1 Tax=Dokdonella sp. MW10 TaxID=2992926 RepID=UPI003F814117
MHWPDGSWCHCANRYLRELFERGLSRRNRGGSIATAAAHTSHLVRFCWRLGIDFIELTNNQFSQFIAELIAEKKYRRSDEKARDANSTIAIGRSCIALLISVAAHFGDSSFVGPKGRIVVYRAYSRRECQGPEYKKTYGRSAQGWRHAAFPTPDRLHRRLPIKSADIQCLRDAIHRFSRTSHQRARRRVMLKLLEITGQRRGEVSEVTVDSVRRAASMEEPMLRTLTLKRSGGKEDYRYVPICRADAMTLLEYADVHRRTVVRRILKGRDHGVFLVNGRTGEPLRPGTITQEIRFLAKKAGIRNAACPHMFRHRFITKLFVTLIERHRIENTDKFRQLFLSAETLKQKIMEWTGHKSTSSLEQYIHLAFDEASSYKEAYDHVRVTSMLESFTGILSEFSDRLREGEPALNEVDRVIKLATALRADILKTARRHEPGEE